MQTPTEDELQHFLEHVYDPVKAHEYYERTKKLKGRKPGKGQLVLPAKKSGPSPPPLVGVKAKGKSPVKGRQNRVRAKQRKELASQVKEMEKKEAMLHRLIKKRARTEVAGAELGKGKVKGKKKSGKHSVVELQVMVTNLRNQIDAAKQKLAAL